MAVGIFEIQAGAAVTLVDRRRLGTPRVGPVRHLLVADAVVGRVELGFAEEEGVMLGGDRPAGLGEIQRYAVVGLDYQEMPEPRGGRQAEDAGGERRRSLLGPAGNNGGVPLQAHIELVPNVGGMY